MATTNGVTTAPTPMRGADMTDADLVRLAAAGDLAAFDALYHRHAARMWRHACRVLREMRTPAPDLDAWDAVDTAFLWLRAGRWHLDGVPLPSYFTTMARLGAYDTWKRLYRAHRGSLQPDGEAVLARLPQVLFPDPEAALLARECEMRMRAVVAALPPAARRIALLRLEARSSREIAEILGITEGTVTSTLAQTIRPRFRAAFPEWTAPDRRRAHRRAYFGRVGRKGQHNVGRPFPWRRPGVPGQDACQRVHGRAENK